MKDIQTILTEFAKVDFSRRKAALATVVKVRGSSYRSPGARMLITDDGRWVGSISGGCLEGDALRKARQVMLDRQPMTVTYDTREESNQNLGIGLGCNGVIDVLIEALDPAGQGSIKVFQKILESEEPIALATVYESSGSAEIRTGDKLALRKDGTWLITTGSGALEEKAQVPLKDLFITGKSEINTLTVAGTPVEVFIELVQPCISLILFGAGFDARPVSQMAKALGWNITVTDECAAHIAPLFFPTADKLSLCHREWVDREMKVTPYTACILMSHNYDYDRDVLKKLLKTETPYIGILGPRKRFDKMQEEFLHEGIILNEQELKRIHSPIGLDIGAETPDEIAISILSEIQARFSNRPGGYLRERSGPIHQRDSKSDQVFKQVYLTEDPAHRIAQ